ncbi:hypothetical protein K435DRAFT_159225 [Dendrothele bispora CBS 962.96]|uniref:Uncharacterized protein n=1 Tax=Dendrothele bispora (strain CBS 962.96) TaxID=1314807 RepID=A0A4S8MP10_DENBC|nr:hypothetical protein K435DRAFT_159225 [Dendrothele bispora CBS 962.96]
MRWISRIALLTAAVLPVLARGKDIVQTHIDLSSFLNNKAASVEGTIANFDGHNGSYPAEYLPTGILEDASITVGFFLYYSYFQYSNNFVFLSVQTAQFLRHVCPR